MLSTDKQTNRQTDRQTNQRYQKHNLLCQGGNNLKYYVIQSSYCSYLPPIDPIFTILTSRKMPGTFGIGVRAHILLNYP